MKRQTFPRFPKAFLKGDLSTAVGVTGAEDNNLGFLSNERGLSWQQ